MSAIARRPRSLGCWDVLRGPDRLHGQGLVSAADDADAAAHALLGIDELPGELGNLDIVVEATGNSTVAFQAMSVLGANGVLCLMGVSTGEKRLEICADCVNTQMVLGNKVVFGSVNANRSHFERAIRLLVDINHRWPGWLARLITRRLPLVDFEEALRPAPNSIKTVIQVTNPATHI